MPAELPAPRRSVRLLPSRIRSRLEHSSRKEETAARSPTYRLAASAASRVWRIGASEFSLHKLRHSRRQPISFVILRALRGSSFFLGRLSLKLLFYNYENTPDFVQYGLEVSGEQRLLGIDDHIGAYLRRRRRKSRRLTQPALHAVAIDRSSQSAPDGETDSKPAHCRRRPPAHPASLQRLLFRPPQVKHGHRRRKVAPPHLVYTLEIGVTQQPQATRKSGARGSRLPALVRCSGHTSGHSASNFQLADATGGFADRTCGERSRNDCPHLTGLFAETWFYRDPLAPLGAAA